MAHLARPSSCWFTTANCRASWLPWTVCPTATVALTLYTRPCLRHKQRTCRPSSSSSSSSCSAAGVPAAAASAPATACGSAAPPAGSSGARLGAPPSCALAHNGGHSRGLSGAAAPALPSSPGTEQCEEPSTWGNGGDCSCRSSSPAGCTPHHLLQRYLNVSCSHGICNLFYHHLSLYWMQILQHSRLNTGEALQSAQKIPRSMPCRLLATGWSDLKMRQVAPTATPQTRRRRAPAPLLQAPIWDAMPSAAHTTLWHQPQLGSQVGATVTQEFIELASTFRAQPIDSNQGQACCAATSQVVGFRQRNCDWHIYPIALRQMQGAEIAFCFLLYSSISQRGSMI